MASVGSQLITPFNAASRGTNRGKNDYGVPIVFLLLSMEPQFYDSNVSSTAQSNGFALRGLDAQPNRTSGVRAGSSFFNGYSPATTPSQLSSLNRRQIAILNGIRNSPGKQYLQILVNDHPDGALSSTESTAMRAAINSVRPAPPNTAPVLTVPGTHAIHRDAVCAPVPISVSDTESPAAALTVTAASSDQALVPDAAIMLSGTGMARDIKITPAPGRTGSAILTITVSDGLLSTQRQFTLTVTDPYVTWADTQGLTGAIRAASLDPDGDSLTNLQEYFHGSPPLQRNTGLSVEYSNGRAWLVFLRSRSAAIQSWSLEAGASPAVLTSWVPAPEDIIVTEPGETERLRIRLPAAAAGFVRLRITR